MRRHAEYYLQSLDKLKTLVIGRVQPSDVDEAYAAVQSRLSVPASDASDGSDAEAELSQEAGPTVEDQDKKCNEGDVIPEDTDKNIKAEESETDSKETARQGQDTTRNPTLLPRLDPPVSTEQLVKLLLHRHRIKTLWSKMDGTIQEEKQRNDAGERYAQIFEREKHARLLRRMSHQETAHIGPPLGKSSRRPRRSPLREEWRLDDWLWEKALDEAKRKEEYWYKKDEEGRRVHKI